MQAVGKPRATRSQPKRKATNSVVADIHLESSESEQEFIGIHENPIKKVKVRRHEGKPNGSSTKKKEQQGDSSSTTEWTNSKNRLKKQVVSSDTQPNHVVDSSSESGHENLVIKKDSIAANDNGDDKTIGGGWKMILAKARGVPTHSMKTNTETTKTHSMETTKVVIPNHLENIKTTMGKNLGEKESSSTTTTASTITKDRRNQPHIRPGRLRTTAKYNLPLEGVPRGNLTPLTDHQVFTRDPLQAFFAEILCWSFGDDLRQETSRNSSGKRETDFSSSTFKKKHQVEDGEINEEKLRVTNFVPKLSPSKVPDSFTSYEHYVSVWKPLALEEIRAQTINSVTTETPTLPSPVALQPVRQHGNEDFMILNVTTKKTDAFTTLDPNNLYIHDLVLLSDDRSYISDRLNGAGPQQRLVSSDSIAILGLVHGQAKSREGLQVRILSRQWKCLQSKDIFLFKLTTLVTCVREFNALTHCKDYPLLPLLLSGKHTLGSMKLEALGQHYVEWLNSHFNQSQIEAITAAATSSGFTLIKGPPGTGKTTTLKALLNSLHLREYNRYYDAVLDVAQKSDQETSKAWAAIGNQKPHILVTAPSNIAVDNIVIKIMEEGFCDGQGRRYFPAIVRVGRGKSQSVKHVALDELVEKIIQTPLEEINQRISAIRLQLQQIESDAVLLRQQFRDLVRWVKSQDDDESSSPVAEETEETEEKTRVSLDSQPTCSPRTSSSRQPAPPRTPLTSSPEPYEAYSPQFNQEISFTPEASFSPGLSPNEDSHVSFTPPPPLPPSSMDANADYSNHSSMAYFSPLSAPDSPSVHSNSSPYMGDQQSPPAPPLETPPPLPSESPPPLPVETPPPLPPLPPSLLKEEGATSPLPPPLPPPLSPLPPSLLKEEGAISSLPPLPPMKEPPPLSLPLIKDEETIITPSTTPTTTTTTSPSSPLGPPLGPPLLPIQEEERPTSLEKGQDTLCSNSVETMLSEPTNSIVKEIPNDRLHTKTEEELDQPPLKPVPSEKITLVNHPDYPQLAQRLNGCLELRNKMLLELQRLEVARMYGKSAGSSVEIRQQLEVSFLDTAHIVFTTLSSAGLPALDVSAKYQVLVIDEAAQAVELSTLIPMRFQSQQCVLVGDPQQLPATCFSKGSERSLYERSLFERLESCHHPVHILRVQYRSHPSISDFPRNFFYQGLLEDGDNVLSPTYTKPYHHLSPALQPLVFFDLMNSRESKSGSSVSRRNVGEAEFAVKLYLILKSSCSAEHVVGKVGVITPYSQQQEELKRQFAGALGPSYASEVEVNTVDGFQGREKDIIILSTVRAEKGGVGFLNDIRRMNVALTRAKYSCFVIGSEETLVTSPPWKALLDHVWAHQCVVQVPNPRVDIRQLGVAQTRRKSSHNNPMVVGYRDNKSRRGEYVQQPFHRRAPGPYSRGGGGGGRGRGGGGGGGGGPRGGSAVRGLNDFHRNSNHDDSLQRNQHHSHSKR